MRYDDNHKERTRARVLAEAAAAIRSKGAERVGVAEVMTGAGLTHAGGFLRAHFKSKDELITEAVTYMFGAARVCAVLTQHGRAGACGGPRGSYRCRISQCRTASIRRTDVRSRLWRVTSLTCWNWHGPASRTAPSRRLPVSRLIQAGCEACGCAISLVGYRGSGRCARAVAETVSDPDKQGGTHPAQFAYDDSVALPQPRSIEITRRLRPLVLPFGRSHPPDANACAWPGTAPVSSPRLGKKHAAAGNRCQERRPGSATPAAGPRCVRRTSKPNVAADQGTRQNRGILYAKAGAHGGPYFWREDAEISVFSDDYIREPDASEKTEKARRLHVRRSFIRVDRTRQTHW